MKISKLILATLVLLTIAFVHLPSSNAEETKIGYINLGRILDRYEKTEKSEKSLEKKLDQKQQEREKLVDEIKKLKDEIVLLSAKGKQEKQSAIDEKIKNLQEFDRELRNELQQERDEALRDILREIDRVIQDFGRNNGYTVILNDRVLVYGDETIEITQDIIDILNKKGQ